MEEAFKETYLTTTEAANILGFTRMTAHRWAKRGYLRAVQRGGRRYFPKSLVERYAALQKRMEALKHE